MKRRRQAAILLVAILLSLIAGQLSAAVPGLAFIPTLYGQPVVSTCSQTVSLLARDVGSLAAVLDAGHYYIAYQDRQAGGKGYVKEHVGAGLVDVAQAPAALIEPSFSPPVVKVGSVAIVPGRLYYTARAKDDTPNEGPYELWCQGF